MPEPADNVITFTPRASRPRKKAARRPAPDVPAGAELEPLIDSWKLALQVQNKSSETLRTYLRSARMLARFLAQQGMPTDAERVQAEHIRAFLLAELERTSAGSAACQHANLSSFFSWLVAEEERTVLPSPVLKGDKPKTHAKATEYLTDDEIRALLAACKGPDFGARRDTAIFRLFDDCGLRVGGMSGALLADLDLPRRTLLIHLKGGDEHLVPFGDKTAMALDRYLRLRKSHPLASSPWLWVGSRGRASAHLTEEGIRAMMERRGAQAGVVGVTPHRFRATFAHNHLAAGGSAQGAMAVAGWRSEAMLRRYTKDLSGQRARDEHARLNVSDRL